MATILSISQRIDNVTGARVHLRNTAALP